MRRENAEACFGSRPEIDELDNLHSLVITGLDPVISVRAKLVIYRPRKRRHAKALVG